MIGANALKDEYESFEMPVGTKFQVPALTIFDVGKALYSGDDVKTKISIGYGDDSVSASATPPTNYIELLEMIPINDALFLYEVAIYIYIPAGKYPCAFFTGGAGNIRLFGQERGV